LHCNNERTTSDNRRPPASHVQNTTPNRARPISSLPVPTFGPAPASSLCAPTFRPAPAHKSARASAHASSLSAHTPRTRHKRPCIHAPPL
jgi:hypothetical protein